MRLIILAFLVCSLGNAQQTVRINRTANGAVTNLIDNFNGTFTFTNEAGTNQTVNKADMVDNFNGTWVFTNFDGSDITINFSALVDNTNPTAISLAYYTQYDFTGGQNTATTYTTTNVTDGGYAEVLINVATEPTVTGATKVPNTQAFLANTDMVMCVKAYGTTVKYWFVEF